MAKTTFQHISDSDLSDDEIRYQIEQGTMDNAKYVTLTADQQSQVKRVLFEMYQAPVPTPQSLSGLEFLLIGLCKIFIKKDTGVALTADEQTFYTNFQNAIALHDMTLASTGWQLPYAQDKLVSVKNNREAYLSKKQAITGSI